MALAPYQRIRQKPDFQRAFKQGRRYHTPVLTLIIVPTEGAHSRLGLAIAKKHCRLAVQRNRIKRVVREFCRREFAQWPRSYDVVTLSKPNIQECSNIALQQALQTAVQRFTMTHHRS